MTMDFYADCSMLSPRANEGCGSDRGEIKWHPKSIGNTVELRRDKSPVQKAIWIFRFNSEIKYEWWC